MRHIQLTEELKLKAIEDFTKKLGKERFANSKISVSIDLEEKLSEETEKPKLYFTSNAWLKLSELVESESGEIGWHGTVFRQGNLFLVNDILLYPQYVTGATVQTEDKEYAEWLQKLSDEEFNTIRYHGHSHVNMGITPSAVDKNWYNEILQGLQQDDYYIFMIINKKNDMFIEIYDLANNMIYEKKDIEVDILINDSTSLGSWSKEVRKEFVKKKVYNYDQTSITDRLDTERISNWGKEKEKKEQTWLDILLNMTNEDLKTPELVAGLITNLAKEAPYTGYFGKGYTHWRLLSSEDKVLLAKKYYKDIKKKSKKTNKAYWEDLYDFDY